MDDVRVARGSRLFAVRDGCSVGCCLLQVVVQLVVTVRFLDLLCHLLFDQVVVQLVATVLFLDCSVTCCSLRLLYSWLRLYGSLGGF